MRSFSGSRCAERNSGAAPQLPRAIVRPPNKNGASPDQSPRPGSPFGPLGSAPSGLCKRDVDRVHPHIGGQLRRSHPPFVGTHAKYSAAFGPEAVKALSQAFDEAWVNVDVRGSRGHLRVAPTVSALQHHAGIEATAPILRTFMSSSRKDAEPRAIRDVDERIAPSSARCCGGKPNASELTRFRAARLGGVGRHHKPSGTRLLACAFRPAHRLVGL
jgi:hypothetical protein